MRLTHNGRDVKRKLQVWLKSDTKILNRFDIWERKPVEVIDSQRRRIGKACNKDIAFLKRNI